MNDVAWALQTARQVGPIHPPHAHAHPIHKAHLTHTGPLRSHVAGRTDHLPSQVPNGSFVLPADIVSGLGEGNTEAGFKIAKRMFEGAGRHFGGLPYAGDNGPYGQGGGLPYAIVKGHAAGGLVVAGKHKDTGQIITGRPGQIHSDVVRPEMYDDYHFGFATPSGEFLDRNQAMEYAHQQNQLKDGISRHYAMGHLDSRFLKQPGVDEYAAGGSVADSSTVEPPTVNRAVAGSNPAPSANDEAVPVAVAGGEHVLAPHEVSFAGMGDTEAGHKALEAFVLRQRAKLIKDLKGLPGPSRD